MYVTTVIVLLLGAYLVIEKSKGVVVINLSRQLAANNNEVGNTFESTFEIVSELQNDIDDEKKTVGEELARKFPHAYNSLQTSKSDPLNRVVSSAKLVENKAATRRYLQQRENKKNWWYKIQVTGSCSLCKYNTRLFVSNPFFLRQLFFRL